MAEETIPLSEEKNKIVKPVLIYRCYIRKSDGRMISASSVGKKAWATPVIIRVPHHSGTAFIGKFGQPSDEDLPSAEPTEEEKAAIVEALDEAEAAANRALSQAKRNTFGLRAARLEIETARSIAAASNRTAEALAGVAE